MTALSRSAAGPAPRGVESPPPPAVPEAACQRWRFAMEAEADPGMLARLLEPFAKRGLVPERWASRLSDTAWSEGESMLSVRCTVAGLTPQQADTVAAFLAGVPGVVRVIHAAGDTAG